VSIGVILSGLACGMLLVALGMTIWGARIPRFQLSRVRTIIRWGAGSALLIAALASGRGDVRFAALAVMAALAVLPLTRRPRSVWQAAIAILLTGLCLAWAIGAPADCALPSSPILLASIAAAGGLGAQAFDWPEEREKEQSSEHDGETDRPNDAPAWMAQAAFAILTVTVGGVALVDLWRWGIAWYRPTHTSGLVGTWLVWAGAWEGAWMEARIAPRHPWQLRAALRVLALVLLAILITQCP
jgi:hypothetical protein